MINGCEYMRKLWRYFLFQCKMAKNNLLRHLGLSLSAIFSVTITLMLISVFMLITLNLSNFTYYIEDEVLIRASIDQILTDDEQQELQQSIAALNNVESIEIYTGAEELEAYKNEYTDEQSLFSMYDGDTSPIRDTFIIQVNDKELISQTSEEVSNLQGIVSVNYGGDTTNTMIKAFHFIQQGSLVFISFLVLIAIFLIANKIKMSIYTRKSEIAIMRFVGASNWCIRFPMMLEGIVIGCIGAILPIAVTIYGYSYIYKLFDGILFTQMFQLMAIFPFTLYISLVLIVAGGFVGLIGSGFSTSKYLRWKR